jgi:hypothetical protein
LINKVSKKPIRKRTTARNKTPKGIQALVANFNTELNTAGKINTRCVSHNIALDDKFAYIGHLVTLHDEKHIINAELSDGKTVQFQPVISYKAVKTVNKKEVNV